MSQITVFVIPSIVADKLGEKIDKLALINAVQAEINAGARSKTSASSKAEWRMKKDDGKSRLVIQVTTKAGEKFICEDSIPAKFYCWCLALMDTQSFGLTPFELPSVFKTWIGEKFTKAS